MATKMQKAFAKSAIRRKMALFSMLDMNMPIKGYKRLFNGIMGDVLEGVSEPQIKLYLFELLQCADITPEEQAEAIKLLQMSETTLTARQRAKIDYFLME